MINVDHLIYHYQQLTLRYHFTVPKGQFVAILGASGSGKSTLLNLLAGFIFANAGHIYLNNKQVTTLPANQRPLTMLFQENNLFTHLTINQNIGLGLTASLKLTHQQQKHIDNIATLMGIDDCLNRRPIQLSGGQRQRAALARCLIQQRPILLLDEPFSALDFQRKREMYQLLTNIQHQYAKTILMVTHDLADIEQLAQRALVINAGEIVYDGNITQIPTKLIY